jgi:hypothetical protein
MREGIGLAFRDYDQRMFGENHLQPGKDLPASRHGAEAVQSHHEIEMRKRSQLCQILFDRDELQTGNVLPLAGQSSELSRVRVGNNQLDAPISQKRNKIPRETSTGCADLENPERLLLRPKTYGRANDGSDGGDFCARTRSRDLEMLECCGPVRCRTWPAGRLAIARARHGSLRSSRIEQHDAFRRPTRIVLENAGNDLLDGRKLFIPVIVPRRVVAYRISLIIGVQ